MGTVKITFEDIKGEVEFWVNTVVCHVLGANPPLHVMEGFIKRVWGKYGIDRVALIGKGIFIVRFNSIESRNKELDEGIPMFDKKPVIVKPWTTDLDIKKFDVRRVPIWVRLIELDLKYWGQSTLMKLGSMLGKPVKTDRATAMKELLHDARLLIEVSIDEDLPETITFENEWGAIQHYGVQYEWKPVKCSKCGMFGHQSEECKKHSRQEKGSSREAQVLPKPPNIRRPGKEPAEQLISVMHNSDMVQQDDLPLVFGSVNLGESS